MRLFSVVFLLLSMLACGSADKQIENFYKIEGWVDENTYRVMSVGSPKEDILDKKLRRYYAKKDAISFAQRTIIEKFTEIFMSRNSDITNERFSDIAVIQKFGDIIIGGTVIGERYADQDSCQMIYEVSSPGLKHRVLLAE